LTTLSLPNCTTIGSSAFGYCPISNLTLGATIVNSNWAASWFEIGKASYVSTLQTLTLPKCSYVGIDAFYGCSTLTNVDLPVLQDVGVNPFGRCQRLSKICVSSTNSYFNLLTENNTLSKEGVVLIKISNSEAVTALSKSGYSNISTNQIKIVGEWAMYAVDEFKTINLPNCTNVKDYAFYDCKNLTTITLPSCMMIGSSVF